MAGCSAGVPHGRRGGEGCLPLLLVLVLVLLLLLLSLLLSLLLLLLLRCCCCCTDVDYSAKVKPSRDTRAAGVRPAQQERQDLSAESVRATRLHGSRPGKQPIFLLLGLHCLDAATPPSSPSPPPRLVSSADSSLSAVGRPVSVGYEFSSIGLAGSGCGFPWQTLFTSGGWI